ncbi:MAG: hypothetical protein IKC63_06605 [Clostridia bacterium]|nr:hypothetical protein [Clostridia bacterium]
MDQTKTVNKKPTPPFVEKTKAHVGKFKYYYLYGAFVILLAILAAVSFIIDSNIADLESARDPFNSKGQAWNYEPLYNYIGTYEAKYQQYLIEYEAWINGLGKEPKAIVYSGNAPMDDRIIEAIKNRAEGKATARDEYWLTDGIDMMNSLSIKFYNAKQVGFFSLFQSLVLIGASIAMLIIIAKSYGQYNTGFSPFFGSNPVWFGIGLASLILALPAAIYSLFVEVYTWPTILFIAFAFAQTTLVAFGQFALRKQGASKLLRLIIPTAGSYVFSLVYLLVAMGNGTGKGTVGALAMLFCEPLVYVILFLAPLFINMAYLSTGTFMSAFLPYCVVGITLSIFPSAILTMSTLLYPTVFFIIGIVALLGGAIALGVLLTLKYLKGVPIPADLVCEMYEEGAPEITTPEAVLAAKKEKKEKKVEKKAKKNDFAFLDEPETTDETTNTPV